jgi:membrane fusion protein, heavy metal efflux system
MMKTSAARVASILLLVVALPAGCRPGGERPHSHADGTEHRHPQDGAQQAAERPVHSVTVYEAGLELFLEYPALVVGMESPLLAHFTDTRNIEGFAPIREGRVVATLEYDGGAADAFAADTPRREGIFQPVVKPTAVGTATLTLKLEGEQVNGIVHAGPVTIHADLAAAMTAPPPDGASEAIAFLKEAQWKTQYATASAHPRVLQGGIAANGELLPVAGQAAELAAPVAGRIVAGESVPYIGQAVKRGELLVSIMPTGAASAMDPASLELEKSRADSELGLAEREVQRVEELFAARAIPQKHVEAAHAALAVARARVAAATRQLALYQAARGGGGRAGGTSFELRSPIDGVVSFARVTRGAVVQAGDRVVSVVNADKLWLEVKVYETDIARASTAPGAVFRVVGFDREFKVDEENGRRVAVGAVVDRATRTVPVVFELTNPGGVLKPGMFAKVTLLTGETVQGVAVPEQAIVDESGQPTVFVLASGESFLKRRVKLGVRSGGYVQILEGVADGERVVSRGAYEVKLATAAGAMPEHGHQH